MNVEVYAQPFSGKILVELDREAAIALTQHVAITDDVTDELVPFVALHEKLTKVLDDRDASFVRTLHELGPGWRMQDNEEGANDES